MGQMTVEEEHIYLNLIAEIPGVELGIDFEDTEDTAQETHAPLLADWAAAATQVTASHMTPLYQGCHHS